MKAGRELDALVAEKVMELEVPGSAVVFIDPECCIPWHGSVTDESRKDVEEKTYRYYWPIYLAHCCCDFKNEQRDREEIFSHSVYCFEPVPFYSTDIAAAWELVEKLRAEDWEADIRGCYSSPHKCAHPWSAFFVESGLGKPFGRMAKSYGDAAPLAICLAALKVRGIDIDT